VDSNPDRCYDPTDWRNRTLKEPESMAELEHKMLRTELHDLKECQFRFLSAAVVAVGALLSITGAIQSRKGDGASDLFRLAYMVPLVVLIPCWWGFFDKAKTITRIVGYFRVLEDILLGNVSSYEFIGWERALGKFREAERQGIIPGFEKRRVLARLAGRLRSRTWWGRSFKAALLIPTQRYWLLAQWTFAVLSFISVGIPLVTIASQAKFLTWQFVAVLVPCLVVVYTFLSHLGILDDLMYGCHSYDDNFGKWRNLLKRSEVSKADTTGRS